MTDRSSPAHALEPGQLLEHSRWMRALARTLVLDGESVDDLVQDAWAAALERPPHGDVPLNAWLAGVLRRRALFLRRGRGRTLRREREVARQESIPSGEELLERAELQQLLLEELRSLPATYRDVLLLRHDEGLLPAAIAEHLQVPVNTVRTRLQRGHDLLRRRLDERHGGDRQAWGLALLPLALPEQVPVTATAAAGLSSWISLETLTSLTLMSATWKIATAAVLAISTTLLLSRPGPEPLPDMRLPAKPEQVASVLQSVTAVRTGDAGRTSPTAATGERVLRGRVVDVDGRPVVDATIEREMAPRKDTPSRVRRLVNRSGVPRTDAEGRFSLRLRPDQELPWVQPVHEDYLAVVHATRLEESGEVTILMSPLGEAIVDVQVVDRSGRDVPRFELLASIPMEGGGSAPEQALTVYSHQHLEGGGPITMLSAAGRPLRLQVNTLGLALDVPPEQLVKTVAIEPSSRATVRFELDLDRGEREANLIATGRIVDARTGAPVPGAEVWLHPRKPDGKSFGVEERRVQSFADGSFRIGAKQGGPDASIRVMHPHYRSQWAHGASLEEVLIELEPRPRLQVRVVDRMGVGVEGAHLEMARGRTQDEWDVSFERDIDLWRAVTGADGRHDFGPLPEDRYMVCVLTGPMETNDSAIVKSSLTLDEGAQEITLTLDRPDLLAVGGRVILPADSPPRVPLFLPHDDESYLVQAELGPGGSFTAGGMAPGEYSVLLYPEEDSDSFRTTILPTITVASFGQQLFTFQLPDGSLTGRLEMKERDLSLLRVRAIPSLPAGFARDALESSSLLHDLAVPVAADGSFHIEHLHAGEWVLSVHDSMGRSIHQETVQQGTGQQVMPVIQLGS